jgi:hypothetical protein
MPRAPVAYISVMTYLVKASVALPVGEEPRVARDGPELLTVPENPGVRRLLERQGAKEIVEQHFLLDLGQVHKAYDPSQPRDERGQWTSGGGASAGEKQPAGVEIRPAWREGGVARPNMWELTSGKSSAEVRLIPDYAVEQPDGSRHMERALYVDLVHAEKPSRDTLRVLHGIKSFAHEKGATVLVAQVINEDLGKVLSKLPGVSSRRWAVSVASSTRTAGTTRSPWRR